MKHTSIALCACASAALTVAPALGQQSFYNTSAAQPSTGTFLFRQTMEYMHLDDDPSDLDREIDQFKLDTQLAYGVTKDLTVIGTVPAFYRETDSDVPGVESEDMHFGDMHFMLKKRIWQRDTGPIDTMRLSLLAGLDVPTSKAPFGNGGWDPMIGAVFTSIQDRHGVNAALRYTFNTHNRGGAPTTVDDGLEDTLWLDMAYLFRLAPAEYRVDSHGAWFAVIEMNGTYETNDDLELRLAPGIMYEARNWVFEAAVQFPVYEDIDHRLELDIAVGVGFRILF
jgi:hypothetical protein